MTHITPDSKPMNIHKFEIDHVSYMEACVNYTILHYADGRQCIHSYTLKRFEENLSHDIAFSRIHRKYIINKKHVRHHHGSEVVLSCDYGYVVHKPGKNKNHI